MTQADRDRLVTLKKAKKKLITQREAAEALGLTERQVRRQLRALKKNGDKAVVHALRGAPSKLRIDEKIEKEAVRILSAEEYRGFGPTLASEYLRKKHFIEASKETVRQWMMRAKLWRGKAEKLKEVHLWRPRRSRWGELVQWDTSEHDWLEGQGERMYLIAMIDDATSRLFARFTRHDSTEENMKLVKSYVEKFGRPLAFYTDKASHFQTTEKHKRDEPGVEKDAVEMPPTQIGRALRELGITWIGAHSPQAKGRVERCFGTAQDRLVKGLKLAGVKTLEQANQYLEQEYLAWWNLELTEEPANPDNAHNALDKSHNLAAALSRVEIRQVRNDYTIRLDGAIYQIEQPSIVAGLRKANVRVETRLDGSIAVRYQERYLTVKACRKPTPAAAAKAQSQPKHRKAKRGSDWNKNFDLKKAPPVWLAGQGSGHRREGTD
jgi:transposase